MAHDVPLAGHLGRDKTTQRILQRFYWPGIYADVESHCACCKECQKTARPMNQRVPLISIPVVGEPFSLLAMDIVGPLERTKKGNQYILVLVDYATRYPEAVPLRSIDAETIADELLRIFTRVGIPKRLLTDQGSNFTSLLMKQVSALLKITQLQTSPYHPQTDGLVERFNGTLKAMLRRFAREAPKNWDELLPYLLFAYREVPQASTGFSPFELLYGRHVRGPLDIVKSSWTGGEDPEDTNVLDYVMQMRDRLATMTACVQENLGQAQEFEREKSYYDKSARNRSFSPGDRVLLLLPTSARKLLASWQGPFTVIKKVGPVDYEIEMPRSRKRIFHVNMLRAWKEPSDACYTVGDQSFPLGNQSYTEEDISINNLPVSTYQEVSINEDLGETEKSRLLSLLEEFTDIFSNQPGRTALAEHRIILKADKPIRQQAYRIPHAYRERVKEELREMEETGIIRKSNSEWASPLVVVPKKDGSLRLCVDFRKLNSVSEFDAYPMPRVDDVLDRLGSAQYISSIDMTKGYWQIPMAEESKDKTAFITPFGLYEFNVMPFGLHGAPATFQRLMDKLLAEQRDASDAYIDDITVASNSFTEHLMDLRNVFQSVREAGLTIKPRKANLAMYSVGVLGHHAGRGIIKPDAAKIATVQNYPKPVTKKELRAFLGLTGYYRKFISDFSGRTALLSDMLKKSFPEHLRWTEDTEQAFQSLKQALCKEPVLQAPDFRKKFILQTDASRIGIGAVLSQVGDDGLEHPVAYASRKLQAAERNYATIEQECLAIKWGVEKFAVYLLGKEFEIQTDHAPLKWLQEHQHNARVARWALELQPFQFYIKHRAGNKHCNADSLSRF